MQADHIYTATTSSKFTANVSNSNHHSLTQSRKQIKVYLRLNNLRFSDVSHMCKVTWGYNYIPSGLMWLTIFTQALFKCNTELLVQYFSFLLFYSPPPHSRWIKKVLFTPLHWSDLYFLHSYPHNNLRTPQIYLPSEGTRFNSKILLMYWCISSNNLIISYIIIYEFTGPIFLKKEHFYF